MALNPRFFILPKSARGALAHASVRRSVPAASARCLASSAGKGKKDSTPSEWMGEKLRAAVPPDPSGFAGQGEAAKKGAAGMDRISGPMNSLGAAVREGAAAAGYKPAQQLQGVGSTAGAVSSAPSDDYDYRKDPMQFEFDRPDRSDAGASQGGSGSAGGGGGMGLGGRSITGFGLRDTEGPPRAANSSSGDDDEGILRDPLEQEFDRPVLDMPTQPGPQASVGQPTRPGKSSSAGMRHMYHTSTATYAVKKQPGMGEEGRAPHLAGAGDYGRALGDDNSANLSGKLKGSDTKGKGGDWDTKSVNWLDQQLRASGSDPSTMANTWTGGKDPMRPKGTYGTVGLEGQQGMSMAEKEESEGSGQGEVGYGSLPKDPSSSQQAVPGTVRFGAGTGHDTDAAQASGKGNARLGSLDQAANKGSTLQSGRGFHSSALSSMPFSRDGRTLSNSDGLDREQGEGMAEHKTAPGMMPEGKGGRRQVSDKDVQGVVPGGGGQDDRADTYGRRAAASGHGPGQPTSAARFDKDSRAPPSPGLATAAGGKGKGFSGTGSSTPSSASDESGVNLSDPQGQWPGGPHPLAGAEHPTAKPSSGFTQGAGMDAGKPHSTNRAPR